MGDLREEDKADFTNFQVSKKCQELDLQQLM